MTLTVEQKAELYDYIVDEFYKVEDAYGVLDIVEYAMTCPEEAIRDHKERVEEGFYDEE